MSCYQKFETALSNADSQANCASKNGQLAVINTEAEYNFVYNLRNSGQDIWVSVCLLLTKKKI